jgi:hypothetical protein
MRCVSQGTLRAYLDGEIDGQAQEQIEAHLASCARCRARLAQVQQAATMTRERLTLSSATRGNTDISKALARVQSLGRAERISTAWRDRIMGKRTWRTAISAAAVLIVLVGVFSFAPSRALARQFLSIFRVRKFAAIQINPDQTQLEAVGNTLQEKFFMEEPEAVVDEPVVKVDSLEEARQIAGFDVRMPPSFANSDDLRFEVKGRTELRLPLKRESLVALVEMAGLDASSIGDGWEEGEVRAVAPAMAYIQEGSWEVVQVWDPSIEYPEGVDPSLIGEAGLILLGLSPKDARKISASIDWTSTVLLPVPSSVARLQETRVAGEAAILLESAEAIERPESVLFWEKDGVLYLVSGPDVGSGEFFMEIAESMF